MGIPDVPGSQTQTHTHTLGSSHSFIHWSYLEFNSDGDDNGVCVPTLAHTASRPSVCVCVSGRNWTGVDCVSTSLSVRSPVSVSVYLWFGYGFFNPRYPFVRPVSAPKICTLSAALTHSQTE